MAWTYDPALPTDKDRVRFLVGDTDTTWQQLQDEEIAYLVAQRSDVQLAAADAARGLAAKYARQVDTSNLSLSVSASERATAYYELADRLEANSLRTSGAQMFAGGLTISGKEALSEDTDAVQPSFSVGQDDEPGANASGTWPSTGQGG